MCLQERQTIKKIRHIIIMKILGKDNFITERLKVKPVTNAEWDNIKKDIEAYMKNPFRLTKKDLIDDIKNFPMGVVVRMMEEMKKQRHHSDLRLFQTDVTATFAWSSTEAGQDFWRAVIKNEDFNLFFNKYPEYRKYNLD